MSKRNDVSGIEMGEIRLGSMGPELKNLGSTHLYSIVTEI